MRVTLLLTLMLSISCSMLKGRVPEEDFYNRFLSLDLMKETFAKYNVTGRIKRNFLSQALRQDNCSPDVVKYILDNNKTNILLVGRNFSIEPNFLKVALDTGCADSLKLLLQNVQGYIFSEFVDSYKFRSQFSERYKESLMVLTKKVIKDSKSDDISKSIFSRFKDKIFKYEDDEKAYTWRQSDEGQTEIQLKNICDIWNTIRGINQSIQKEKTLSNMSGYENAYNTRMLYEQLYVYQLELTKQEKGYTEKPNYLKECSKR
jgi:hypothetical protein